MDWFATLESMPGSRAVVIAAGITLIATACVRALRRTLPETHKRGVLLQEGAAWQRRCRRLKRSDAGMLTLAGSPIAPRDETKHFKLIGTTGTGKSTAIREMLGAALQRGDRAVFADPDGGYVARFFDRYRGDIVLNPFERASVKWDVFSEINNSYDVEQLASGLIPSSNDASAERMAGLRPHVLERRDAPMPGGTALRQRGIVAPARRGAERGAAIHRRRHPCAALSRSRERPHVRLDPIGNRVGDCGVRARAGPARRALFRARVGANESDSRRYCSFPTRPDISRRSSR